MWKKSNKESVKVDNLFRAKPSIKEEKNEKGELMQKKDKMLKNLQEVEAFLRQGKKALKGIKLYNILKK